MDGADTEAKTEIVQEVELMSTDEKKDIVLSSSAESLEFLGSDDSREPSQHDLVEVEEENQAIVLAEVEHEDEPESDTEGLKLPKEWKMSTVTRPVFGPFIPNHSYDIDHDGDISARDVAFALVYDINRDGVLDDAERARAKRAMRRNYPKKWAKIHPQFDVLESAVWSNDVDTLHRVWSATTDLSADEQRQVATCLLMAAAQAGQVSLLEWLVEECGADPEQRNQRKQTAVVMAAEFGQWEAVQALRENAHVNLEVIDEEGRKVITYAAKNNIHMVKWLIEAGSSISINTFQYALDDALASNSYNVCGFLFGLNHSTMSVNQFLAQLFKLGKGHQVALLSFHPHQFYDSILAGLERNSAPLSGALKMADVFIKLAEQDKSLKTQYLQFASSCTRRASWLWEYIDSDVLASLLLEQAPQTGVDRSPLELALNSGNSLFVSNARVNRIIKDWWRPFPLTWSSLLTSPGDLFRTPIVKFYLDAFSFIVFLCLFSYLMILHFDLEDPVARVEYVLLAFGVSYFLNEMQQLYSVGLKGYWEEGWNKFDLTMCVSIGVIAACRGPDWGDGADRDVVNVIYLTSMVVTTIVMWVRALFLFTAVPDLGPLLLTLRKMVFDIINFSLLQVVFLVAFFFCFFFIVRGGDPTVGDFEDAGDIFLTLFQGGFTGEPLKEFDALSTSRRVMAQILGSVYLLISAVVLVNLLIAMMGSTFQEVSDNSDLEFLFQRVETRWRYDQSLNDLPPPFNLIALLLFAITWTTKLLLNCCHIQHGWMGEALRTDQYCVYCHRKWKDGTAHKEVYWFVSARFPSLANFTFDKHNPENADHRRVIDLVDRGVICSCVRMKKLLRGDRFWYERISVYIFSLCLWVPVVSVYLLVLLVKKTAKAAFGLCSKYGASDDDLLVSDSDSDDEDDRKKQEEVKKRKRRRIKGGVVNVINPYEGVQVPDLTVHTEKEKLDRVIALQKKLMKLLRSMNGDAKASGAVKEPAAAARLPSIERSDTIKRQVSDSSSSSLSADAIRRVGSWRIGPRESTDASS